jgi:hypothetical protein
MVSRHTWAVLALLLAPACGDGEQGERGSMGGSPAPTPSEAAPGTGRTPPATPPPATLPPTMTAPEAPPVTTPAPTSMPEAPPAQMPPVSSPPAEAPAQADLGPLAKMGQPQLKSVGPLAFAPNGVLLVGDSLSSAVFAIDTGDTTPGTAADLDIPQVDAKIAALLGMGAGQVTIADLAVNPLSKKAYLSVMRGAGATAQPVIVRVAPDGELEALDLASVRYAQMALPNPSTQRPTQAITDILYHQGKVLVTGLSSEQFASKLRTLPYPFTGQMQADSVEIYHTAHGALETRAPILTMALYEAGGTPYLLGAYTCTPLVRIPLADFGKGGKVSGATIAELGAGNSPYDMIVYKKGGADHLLITNQTHGVLKTSLAGAESAPALKTQTRQRPSSYQQVSRDQIQQLDKYDDSRALVVSGGRLHAMPLP